MKHVTWIIFLFSTINLLASAQTEETYKGWLRTETDHFSIIYEETSRESAKEILLFCEDVYRSVTSFFNSYPQKITVVLHSNIDFSNGSYNPIPPHINIYLTNPGTPELGAGVDNWLRFVLTHELTHYVNMNLDQGIFYNLSKVFGRSISSVPGGLLPGWAIEGIAVKLETDLTGTGRGNNPFFEIFSRSLILEDKMFSWRQAAFSSLHPPSGRIYIAGYLINSYMAQKYGNDIFVKAYREFIRFPLPGFNHYIKKVTGDSVSKIFQDMKSELSNKYAEIPMADTKSLFPETESNYYLPVITDKGWICYRDTADKEPAIVLIDPETKNETVLVNTRLTDYSSFSADRNGKFVVFTALDVSRKERSGLTAGSDLFIYDRNRDKTTRITYNSHLRQPAISSDGKRIIAVQLYGQYSRLVEIDTDTGQSRTIFNKKDKVFNPIFSTNDDSIAFTVQNNGNRAVWIIDHKGNSFSLTEDLPGNDYHPTFIDNNNILFVSDITGIPELYQINIESGKEMKKVFSDPAGIFSGILYNKKVIYSTWCSTGYTLKEAHHNETDSFTQIVSANFSNSDIPDQKPTGLPAAEKLNENKYYDLPKMIATLPIPFYIDPLYQSNQIFGPGVSSYFQSILGKTRFNFTATLNTNTMQPGITFQYIHNWGPLFLNYSLLQGYSPLQQDVSAIQTTNQKLLLTFPIVNNSILGKSTYLGIFTGIENSFNIVSESDFYFFAPHLNSTTDFKSTSYLINGFSFLLERNKSVRDLITPWKFVSSSEIYTPLNYNFLKDIAVKNTTSFNIPSLFNHQVIRVSNRLTYSSMDNLEYLNNPRGFPGDSPETCGFIPSLDYLFTIAMPDLPILGGLSLQGISGSFHVEKIISLDKTGFIPDKEIYGGIELLILGNYITIFETAGIGLSYRYNPNNISFDSSNMGIYIFAGTNSFSSGMQ